MVLQKLQSVMINVLRRRVGRYVCNCDYSYNIDFKLNSLVPQWYNCYKLLTSSSGLSIAQASISF